MSIRDELILINSNVKRKRIVKFFSLKLIIDVVLVNISLLLIALSIVNIKSFISYFGYEKLFISVIERTVVLPNDEMVIKEYTVSKGDNLYTISRKLGTSISTIVSLNNLSSQSLLVGKKLLYSNKDVIKYRSKGRFSVFEVSRRYGIHPYDVFVANGFRFWFDGECLVPGVQLSWSEVSSILGIGFLKPLIGRITSGFGYRIHPVLGIRKFHSGLDISAPYGHNVRAALSGVVSKVGFDEEGYGYYIVVSHSGNTKTLYGHLSKIFVKVGQKVNRGEIIGKVGDTGMTTGPHLHFEVIKNNQRVNPKKYILLR
ncbi:MAG: peptidoglycan DD-metalloendopeptidase family protein [Brevinematia bacterium]